jgi:hypothetical protein
MAKTLTVYLAADVSKLNRSLKSAEADMQGFSGTLNRIVGPALLATTAAAAAFAVKLGVDGVKAAIEDQASLERLAKTLENVGLAHDTEQIEAYISSLERTLGIADEELRPAYDRLVRSTQDTETANKALALALDVSAGSGKSLDAVVQALGRAYDGNTAGLSRLGAGIDAATLKTGDMELITATLAQTFAGQATTSAATFEGQTKRLSTAADNLKEAFGAGLLRNLGDTDAATQDLVDRMGKFEETLTDIGEETGNLLLGLKRLTDGLEDVGSAEADAEAKAKELRNENKNLAQSFFSAGDPITGLGVLLLTLVGNMGITERKSQDVEEAQRLLEAGYRANSRAAIDLGNDTLALGGALDSTYRDFIKFATVAAQSTKTTADQAERAQTASVRLDALERATSRLTQSTSGSSTATEVSTAKFDAQAEVVDKLNQKFRDQTQDLADAKDAISSYASNLSRQITQGFNLGAGFTMDNGEVDAAKWLAGVDAEVSKYEWYGNVLAAVQRDAGTNGEALRAYLASQGIDQGATMGQALIDNGLVATMGEKLATVTTKANEVAQAMVPEFMQAGKDQAIANLSGMAEELTKETDTLKKIGKNIGKPIGANIKAEIAAAVAQAIKDAEAAGSAARAEVAAREASRQATLTEQATAQSLARLIRNSDSRAGRDVQPVLA